MDCERFGEVVIDAVYEELDELTLAAFWRHADGCARCQASWSGLRAARRIAVMPRLEVAPEVTERILAAAHDARVRLPWHRRLGQVVSWAGAYAMRPQVAMAALLVLMLGSSLLLLRTRRGGPATLASRVSVTEHGAPEVEAAAAEPHADAATIALDEALAQANRIAARRADDVPTSGTLALAAPAAVPAASAPAKPQRAQAAELAPTEPAPAPTATASAAPTDDDAPAPVDPYASAMALYKAGRFADAAREFEILAGSGGRNAAQAALYAARSTQQTSGCSAAEPRYEAVAGSFPGTGAAGDALWAAAACQRSMGNFERARDLYLSLRTIAGYRDRAEAELANLAAALPGGAGGRRSPKP